MVANNQAMPTSFTVIANLKASHLLVIPAVITRNIAKLNSDDEFNVLMKRERINDVLILFSVKIQECECGRVG